MKRFPTVRKKNVAGTHTTEVDAYFPDPQDPDRRVVSCRIRLSHNGPTGPTVHLCGVNDDIAIFVPERDNTYTMKPDPRTVAARAEWAARAAKAKEEP